MIFNNKKIKIIEYNFDKKIFKLSGKDIDINNNNNNFGYNNSFFYRKCIQISNELIACSYENNILVWSKNNDNYSLKKNININASTYDLLLMDTDNYITSQPDIKSLRIFNIKKLEQIKIINNIDCIKNDKCLVKIDDKYIVVNCYNGLGIVYIKTKELIQYTEEFHLTPNNKILLCHNDRYFYIVNIGNKQNQINNNNINSQINLSFGLFSSGNDNRSIFYNATTTSNLVINVNACRMINGLIKKVKEYDNIELVENINNIIYSNKNLILFGNNAYSFKLLHK